MSATRAGEWHLLGYDSDPVPADPAGLEEVIEHYEEIALAMTTQAALLKKIGDGDTTLLKGKSADAMRKRARESQEALGKAGGRYGNARDAIAGYKPPLEIARSQTGKALIAAEEAAAAQAVAESSADPVHAGRPDDAPPLTDGERQQSQKRADAISVAKGDLETARTMARSAMADLDAAAERAANLIRQNWDDDGLKHSGWDEFVYHLNQALKKIVEILGYLGMIFAVLAMIIPGLGALAWAALAVAVLGVLGSIALAAQGEGSWLSVILGFVGVIACGVGVVVAKQITAALAKAAAQGPGAAQLRLIELTNLARGRDVFRANLGGPFSGVAADALRTTAPAFINGVQSVRGLQGAVAATKSSSWLTSGVRGAIGLEGLKNISAVNAALRNLGWTTVGVPRWVYVGGPTAVTSGFLSGAWSTVVPPSAFPGPDARSNWGGRADFEYAYLTSSDPIIKPTTP